MDDKIKTCVCDEEQVKKYCREASLVDCKIVLNRFAGFVIVLDQQVEFQVDKIMFKATRDAPHGMWNCKFYPNRKIIWIDIPKAAHDNS